MDDTLIAQIKRDIRIIKDILEEKMPNYTKRSFSELKDYLRVCEEKLNKILHEKGGL